MRVCKNCGYFIAVTGHCGTEYCDRPFDEKGCTCKGIGAFRVWEKSKSADEVFKIYRQEYKKYFAWIKAGRVTKKTSSTLGVRKPEKKMGCGEGKIMQEELSQWLKKS